MIPLSHAQQRLWFLNRLEGPNATYNMPALLRLTGALDRAALAAALQDLVDRHEPLRTVFIDQEDVPHQRFIEPGDARLDVAVTEVGPPDITDRSPSWPPARSIWRRRYPYGLSCSQSPTTNTCWPW
jgi:pristinamycin I synthase-3/4